MQPARIEHAMAGCTEQMVRHLNPRSTRDTVAPVILVRVCLFAILGSDSVGNHDTIANLKIRESEEISINNHENDALLLLLLLSLSI